MLTLISYDVVEDKRRRQVMKLLLGYGARVQYSVFEADLTPQQFAVVRRELAALIDKETDSVRCYLLDAATVQHIQIIGIGRVMTQETFILIGG